MRLHFSHFVKNPPRSDAELSQSTNVLSCALRAIKAPGEVENRKIVGKVITGSGSLLILTGLFGIVAAKQTNQPYILAGSLVTVSAGMILLFGGHFYGRTKIEKPIDIEAGEPKVIYLQSCGQ